MEILRGVVEVERGGDNQLCRLQNNIDKYCRLALGAKLLVNNPPECHYGVFRV